ncbi:hypothetical protein M8C21_002239, partial [Ambrosia artemisiifolia]
MQHLVSSSSSDASPKSFESNSRSECSMFTDASNESNTPKSHELPEILNLYIKLTRRAANGLSLIYSKPQLLNLHQGQTEPLLDMKSMVAPILAAILSALR